MIVTGKAVIHSVTLFKIFSIQGSQSEPLRRVRVACKATSTFPHACASYNSAGDIPPVLYNPDTAAAYLFCCL